MKTVENALGRNVPTQVNGQDFEPFCGAFQAPPPRARFTPPDRTDFQPGRDKRVSSLDAVVGEHLPDGGWLSIPHYYRQDATALRLVVDSLRRCGKRNIHILGAAFFHPHAEILLPAVREGIVAGFEANVYGGVARAVGEGRLLREPGTPWTVVGRSHGARARVFQRGERGVDLAIAPVPIADRYGNANGVMGNLAALCGPLGLFDPDARGARRVALLTEVIHPTLLAPAPIDMRYVDDVLEVPKVGDNRGIGTGTTDIRRVRADTRRQRIAHNVMQVIQASGVVREGFNFQIGSGAGLLVLEQVLRDMRARGIRGGFTMGGSMEFHVDLLEEGLIELFLDGQCFQPSERLFRSLRENHCHQEISTTYSYSPISRTPVCELMDVVVLGASEIDRSFNVNTVTGYDGVLRTGIGGGPDAAAGAALTIFALPSARVNRAGRSAPCIRDRVTTVVTPGEVVSAVVTEDHVAINPRSRSPHLDTLRDRAGDFGLELVSMDEMVERALVKARSLGTLMDEPEFTDEVVMAVEWRDGRLIDVVRALRN